MHTITKSFNFCYGHRVWSQQLDEKLSLNMPNKCRHLHGHEGRVEIGLNAHKLENGMVTDFNNLAWFKKWLDDTLDHKFIVDRKDPLLFGHFIPSQSFRDLSNPYYFEHLPEDCWRARPRFRDEEMCEWYRSFVIVDFLPTSENIALWLFDVVQKKMMNDRISVSYVALHETEKTSSKFTR